MKTKKWYSSLTLWTNVILALVAGADALFQANMLDPKWYIGIGVVANILLRVFKTDSAITA